MDDNESTSTATSTSEAESETDVVEKRELEFDFNFAKPGEHFLVVGLHSQKSLKLRVVNELLERSHVPGALLIVLASSRELEKCQFLQNSPKHVFLESTQRRRIRKVVQALLRCSTIVEHLSIVVDDDALNLYAALFRRVWERLATQVTLIFLARSRKNVPLPVSEILDATVLLAD
jgi:hypothetical protein